MNTPPLRNFVFGLLALISSPFASAATPDEIRARVHDRLAAIAADPALVAAVKEQNARGQTLAEIQAADKVWMATPGVSPLMQKLMDSPLAQRLRGLREQMPFLAESFVMDHLGANVAMTEKTSDYWQGDEAKFTDCVKDGGQTWVGKLLFDDSTQTYSVQISLPIRDGDKIIGAICFGIDVENL
jgi:hypothetical protein